MSNSYAEQAKNLISSFEKDGRTGLVQIPPPEGKAMSYFGYALLPGWTPEDLKKIEQVEADSNAAMDAGGSMRENFKNTSVILAESPDCWLGRDTGEDGSSRWTSIDINTGERNSESRPTLTELVPQVIKQHNADELGWDKLCVRNQAAEAAKTAQAAAALNSARGIG